MEEERGRKTMAVNLNTDLQALNMQRGPDKAGKTLAQSMRRLSSGARINSASDDGAGMAAAQQLSEVLRGLNASMGNVQNGYGLLSAADGGLSEAEGTILRMRGLAVLAANGALSDKDRAALQAEMDVNLDQLDGIASGTQFNGQLLLNDPTREVEIQVGSQPTESMILPLGSVTADDLGLASIDVSTQAGAMNAVARLDSAQEDLSTQRSVVGAIQNGVSSAVRSIGVTMENVLAAQSRIIDADVAQEMMNLAKGKILEQVSISTLAQGNMIPQQVLSLLA
jgi:flagellin